MTITNNWAGWISELSKTRKVIAVEMQGHGRTADVPRDITYKNLAEKLTERLTGTLPTIEEIEVELGKPDEQPVRPTLLLSRRSN